MQVNQDHTIQADVQLPTLQPQQINRFYVCLRPIL